MTEISLANILINFLSNILIDTFSVNCWQKCYSNSNNKNLAKTTIIILTLSIIVTVFMFIFPKPIKMTINFFVLTIICYWFITKQLKHSLILIIISQAILWISECSFMIFMWLFQSRNIEMVSTDILLFLILNIYITFLSFIMLKFHIPQKLYKLLVNSTSAIKNNETIIYSLMIIAILVISTAESYMQLPMPLVLITNVIIAIAFIIIIVTSSKLKNNYNQINKKYETSISSLKEYEVMIDKFRVYTHENKNEFYTIRNMLKNGDDRNEVIKYIDTLIDNKIQDNEKIMKKTAKIPSGGLRATIYSKLCLMDKLKIKYKLNISRDVRTTDLINLDEDLVLKICKILGVFLDNAIEAVKGLKKKEISVEIYIIGNDLCIDITNNFKGNLDLTKISEAKYTTKGEGHGYGLTLVNQIINDESGKLVNEKSINRDTFTQTLKIKM